MQEKGEKQESKMEGISLTKYISLIALKNLCHPFLLKLLLVMNDCLSIHVCVSFLFSIRGPRWPVRGEIFWSNIPIEILRTSKHGKNAREIVEVISKKRRSSFYGMTSEKGCGCVRVGLHPPYNIFPSLAS